MLACKLRRWPRAGAVVSGVAQVLRKPRFCKPLGATSGPTVIVEAALLRKAICTLRAMLEQRLCANASALGARMLARLHTLDSAAGITAVAQRSRGCGLLLYTLTTTRGMAVYNRLMPPIDVTPAAADALLEPMPVGAHYERCVRCGREQRTAERRDALLPCRRCPRAFHDYCLKGAEAAGRRRDWRCPVCRLLE